MVVKIGVEIELASVTTSETDNVLETLNWERCHDGSVTTRGNQRPNEFKTTTPYNVNMRNIEETIAQIGDDFKRILETLDNVSDNESCGIHFHFSGIKKWSVFFSGDFFEYVKTKYERFCTTDKERARLMNRFCKWEYSPTDTDRYKAINILGAYERHKTFEFRFFPSTKNVDTFKRYVRFVLEVLKEVQTKEYESTHKSVQVDINGSEVTIKFNI